jgi:hypothetical protein
MIRKWYEVSCDLCGRVFKNYTFRPSPTSLRHEGIKVIFRNGKIFTFCKECNDKALKEKAQ